MAWFEDVDRELLGRLLEIRIDTSRKGNPRLRPLSLRTTELENLKHLAQHLVRLHEGDPSRSLART